MPSATQGILYIYASKLTFEKFCKRATNHTALLWEVFIFENFFFLSGKCCRRREILQSQLTAQFAIENHCEADFSECLQGAEHLWPAAESHTHTRTHIHTHTNSYQKLRNDTNSSLEILKCQFYGHFQIMKQQKHTPQCASMSTTIRVVSCPGMASRVVCLDPDPTVLRTRWWRVTALLCAVTW